MGERDAKQIINIAKIKIFFLKNFYNIIYKIIIWSQKVMFNEIKNDIPYVLTYLDNIYYNFIE